MPKIIVTETDKQDEKVVPLTNEALIGRQPECDIHLPGSGVSREHARIVLEDDQYNLIDLGSGNGTLLNGLLLKANEKNLLRNNDRVTIENFHLKFWRTDELFEESLKEEEEATDPDILEVKLLKKVLDAVDHETVPSFEVLNGSSEGKRFFFTDDVQEMVIGRDPNTDFPINEHVISRRHAKIMKRWGGITLVDLESKNGSYINNKRITEEFLHDGDRIALGTIVLLFRNPQEINLKEIGEELARKRPLSPKYVPPRATKATGEEEGEVTGGSPAEAQEILEDIPSLQPAAANAYPTPLQHEKRLTPFEIGMIGLGIVVFSFALITLVNLILE